MTGAAFPGALPDLLVLAPCLPSPSCPPSHAPHPAMPEGEGRQRWHYMLKFLRQHYTIHLGCFVDRERDRPHFGRIKAMCYETCFVERPAPSLRTLRKLAGAGPHRVAATRDDTLAAWTAQLQRRTRLAGVLACSARMGAYAHAAAGTTRVIDFLDIESDRQQRAAGALRWPAGALRRREARQLAGHERALANGADHALFACESEAARFCAMAPETAHKVAPLANGVDADFYSPHIVHRNPFDRGCRVLVFAGAMDDPANAGAAEWFAREVFIPLHQADPALLFCVAGARPAARVRALANIGGISVTGAVPDLRPYLAHAALVVAPGAAGWPNRQRLLEAMAMQKPVLAAPAALAGLGMRANTELLVADGAAEFARAVRDALAPGACAALTKAARAHVLREWSWPARLAPLATLFEPCHLLRATAN